MPQVSAAVLRSKPSSTSASASIRRAAALSFSPLAALRSSEAVRSSRVIDTAAPIDAAPLKSQHRVRVSLIWESHESQFRAVGITHVFAGIAAGFEGDLRTAQREHLDSRLYRRGVVAQHMKARAKSDDLDRHFLAE